MGYKNLWYLYGKSQLRLGKIRFGLVISLQAGIYLGI